MLKLPLSEALRERYATYAMSVVTNRALPDVRDGLKPGQRRILHCMYHDLKLHHNRRYRKSAAIVGSTLASYHPHGDLACYMTMVRMAQDFSLRYPLVDGQGNFGSIDGDGAASQRYTEARLRKASDLLLSLTSPDTVPYRPNFDATRMEPAVLAARVPHLLLNGVSGIAVGMSTNIPPHHMTEIVDACIARVEGRYEDVLSFVTGPDFPTGGQVIVGEEECRDAYLTGKGSFLLRAKWHQENRSGFIHIIITEIPYGVNKGKLVEAISLIVDDGELPMVKAFRDESTEDVRLVLDLKRGASVEPVMAHLFQNTDLETSFHMNLTCLVPNETGQLVPRQLGLPRVIQHWLDFRLEVERGELEGEQGRLRKELHIQEGYQKLHQHIDAVIQRIKTLESRADVLLMLQQEYELTEQQAERVADARLHTLARKTRSEIDGKVKTLRETLREIEEQLTEQGLRDRVKADLLQIKEEYQDDRRSVIKREAREMEVKETDLIEDVPLYLLLSQEGWIKTQKTVTSVDRIKVKEGDQIVWALKTRSHDRVLFYTTHGRCYTMGVHQLPQTGGYGDALQTLVKFSDGERVLHVQTGGEELRGQSIVLVSEHGRVLRVSVDSLFESSNVNGRQVLKLGDGDQIVDVFTWEEDATVVIATERTFLLAFPASAITLAKRFGQGSQGIRLMEGDRVIGAICSSDQNPKVLPIVTNRGADRSQDHRGLGIERRGGRGNQIMKRGYFHRGDFPPVLELD